MVKKLEFQIGDGIIRLRLEDFLFERFPRLSRMYIREVIRSGGCEVNGRIENRGKRINSGDYIEIEIDEMRETSMRPQELRLDIVFEDPDLIVLDKPAGVLVHPTHRDRSDTLLNALSFYLNAGRASQFLRPGLVHRLDKETSGLIVVAKNLRSHRILAKQFYRKTVEKKYLALVEGVINTDESTIELPIGRFADEKRWDVKDDGKPAVTKLKALERQLATTLVELEPVTGRTNQLRIHCAAIGHPIIGDVSRGGSEFRRLCLHAYRIALDHPSKQDRIVFESQTDFSINGDDVRSDRSGF